MREVKTGVQITNYCKNEINRHTIELE